MSQKKYFTSIIILCFAGGVFAVGGVTSGEATGAYTKTDIVLLFTYVFLALAFSFLCSIAEAVLLSITPSFIGGLAEHKPKAADRLRRLKQDNVDRSLAAILTLNTIAHTVGAIGAGAKATIVFGSTWFGLFSAVMTLMILFFSEIIPKTLGAVFWRHLTGPTAIFVQTLIYALYPLIVISEQLTKLISKGKHIHLFSRDEFIAMADIGQKSGQITEPESRIIRNLFHFQRLHAKDVMTPRTVIVSVHEESTVNHTLVTKLHAPFSRYPLCRTDIDDVSGFVLKDDMLLAKAQGRGEVKLKTLRRKIESVGSEMPLSHLLEFLLDKRQHIALIVDEYGGTKGLVTLEDVVETLLGMEIVDEMDKVEDMQLLARQQWKRRARALGLDVENWEQENESE